MDTWWQEWKNVNYCSKEGLIPSLVCELLQSCGAWKQFSFADLGYDYINWYSGVIQTKRQSYIHITMNQCSVAANTIGQTFQPFFFIKKTQFHEWKMLSSKIYSIKLVREAFKKNKQDISWHRAKFIWHRPTLPNYDIIYLWRCCIF